MIEQYYIWLDAMAARDATLVMLASIAAYLVGGWIALDWAGKWWPEKVIQVVRYLFLAGGVVVYAVTLMASGAAGPG
jgi:hypothetical protein